jgi:hypothetical protein
VTDGCEPGPEAIGLALSLAEDAVAMVRGMVGIGAHRRPALAGSA